MNNQLKPSAFVGYTNYDLTINLDNNENSDSIRLVSLDNVAIPINPNILIFL